MSSKSTKFFIIVLVAFVATAIIAPAASAATEEPEAAQKEATPIYEGQWCSQEGATVTTLQGTFVCKNNRWTKTGFGAGLRQELYYSYQKGVADMNTGQSFTNRIYGAAQNYWDGYKESGVWGPMYGYGPYQ